MSYDDKIKEIIDESEVALFMKGTPDAIMCGNSERALGALRRAGAPITAVDVLVDMQIREDLSAAYGWPTIPQVFVKGELIGGADIVEEMEQLGRPRADADREARRRVLGTPRRAHDRARLNGVERRRARRRAPASTSSACVAGFTFRITFFTLPSASMTNVERTMPMYVLP